MQAQRRLRGKVVTRLSAPLPRHPLVAGADVSYDKGSDKLFAAVVVMSINSTAKERARRPRYDDRRDADRQPVNRGWRAGRPPYYEFETVGCALRTRDGVQPVFVSIGHKIDLPSAMEIVLRCAPKFRIPEPTRQAHILVNKLRSSS